MQVMFKHLVHYGNYNTSSHSFPQRYLSRRYCACSCVIAASLISAMLMEPYNSPQRQSRKREFSSTPFFQASRSCARYGGKAISCISFKRKFPLGSNCRVLYYFPPPQRNAAPKSFRYASTMSHNLSTDGSSVSLWRNSRRNSRCPRSRQSRRDVA